jgi:hypothetical protein
VQDRDISLRSTQHPMRSQRQSMLRIIECYVDAGRGVGGKRRDGEREEGWREIVRYVKEVERSN